MPANGGHRPGQCRRTRRSCQDRTWLHSAPGAGSGAGNHTPVPLRGGRKKTVFEYGGSPREGRCGDESVSRSWRPLLPGVMSVRARWRRRRARAQLMNELLAAMDSPSRLDREDWASASRPVTRCTDPSAARPAVWATAHESAVVADTDHTRSSVISTCRCDELHRNR